MPMVMSYTFRDDLPYDHFQSGTWLSILAEKAAQAQE
jgi:hypothetical protein